MTKRAIVALSAIGMLLTPLGVSAQPLDLKAPAPQSPRERLRALYPDRPTVSYGPSFLPPLSKETEGGRTGVAGWTAPNMAVGSRAATEPDNAGWLGVGFAMEWGGSPTPRKRN
jgi:hypothetical protein